MIVVTVAQKHLKLMWWTHFGTEVYKALQVVKLSIKGLNRQNMLYTMKMESRLIVIYKLLINYYKQLLKLCIFFFQFINLSQSLPFLDSGAKSNGQERCNLIIN